MSNLALQIITEKIEINFKTCLCEYFINFFIFCAKTFKKIDLYPSVF